jgi:hypothetical protein
VKTDGRMIVKIGTRQVCVNESASIKAVGWDGEMARQHTLIFFSVGLKAWRGTRVSLMKR